MGHGPAYSPNDTGMRRHQEEAMGSQSLEVNHGDNSDACVGCTNKLR